MRKNKVLIVDDDTLIKEWLSKELQRNFLDTITALNAEKALQVVEVEDIDIALIDVELPDMSGLELISKIKSKRPLCEIIVITGFGTQEIAIQSLRRGAIDYIEKPIIMEQLYAAIGRAGERLVEKENMSYSNTLLIIDDEDVIVNRLRRFFEKEGYEVFTALSGAEGLSVIEENKIDVIITDIKMGDMDGVNVLKTAKKLYKDIEGIMITGYRDHEHAINSLRAGAIDYITKPVDLDELLFSVNKAIERITLNRTRLYRNRELKISSEIITKMNEELEKRIIERSTEFDKIQAQLFQTSKLATLGEMSAGLAHEMNQPLGGIALVAKHMRRLLDMERLTHDEILSGLNDIEASIKRITKIIQHIRTFARQDMLKFSSVDVPETIDSAFSLLGEQLRLHEIEFICDYTPSLPKITGEPYQLEQVWINLITNARDAMDEKARVLSKKAVRSEEYKKELRIKAFYLPDNGSVVVSVSDNGIGMSDAVKQRVFDPFYTTKEVGKATGLGLSISYGIIESHKGNIEIESSEERGTTIKVTVPEMEKTSGG